MREADEMAERTMTKEAVAEVAGARLAAIVALVPERAGIGIQGRPQGFAIANHVGSRGAIAEERPEILVVAHRSEAGQLQLQKRQMRLVEVDGIDLCGLRGEIGQ